MSSEANNTVHKLRKLDPEAANQKESALGDDPFFIGSASQIFSREVIVTERTTMSVKVTCAKFMEPSRLRFTKERGGPYTVSPILKWKVDALHSVTEPEQAVITFRLLDADGQNDA